MWAIGLSAVAGVAGCSVESRQQVLALLFEEFPAGGGAAHAPVVRSPRHPAPPTPTPTPVAVRDSGSPPAFNTWEDVVRLLPKDQVGNPDWGAALEEQVIAPRPGVAPEALEAEVLALDVALTPRSDPAFAVTFSHEKHGAWLACDNCHPAPFEMQAGATPMTADALHGRAFCGACHGRVAFDIATGCPLCHLRNLPRDRYGNVDWNRAQVERLLNPRAGVGTSADQPILDLDVTLHPQGQPGATVVFSHTVHTRQLACANCHPRLFPMGPETPGTEGTDLAARRSCGACHGSVSARLASLRGKHHEPPLDLDVEISPKAPSPSKTIFSHKIHTQWLECSNCHQSGFPAAASRRMRMADLAAGKYCAGCHGKVAGDLMAHCQRCHTELGDAR